MKSYIYDVEVFPNFFSVVFIDTAIPMSIIYEYVEADINKDEALKYKILSEKIKPRIFVISQYRSDYDILFDFMSVHKTVIGFNNFGYDDIIIDYLLINKKYFTKKLFHRHKQRTVFDELYNLSQSVISYGSGYRYVDNDLKYFKKPYYTKDLQKLLYLDKKFVSLKQVAVQLKWHRLQDLPLPFDTHIERADIPNIIDYNINDVLITKCLFHNQITEIELRESISKLYGVNVRSQSRSGIANKLMMHFYSDATGQDVKEFIGLRTERRIIKYEDIIEDNIQFKNPILKQFLSSLKTKMLFVGADKLKEVVAFDERAYTIATGGLHSKDYPSVYKSTDKHLLIDADVSSFYPRIILNLNIAPKHLNEDAFLQVLDMVISKRLISKTRAKKLKLAPKTPDIEKYLTIFSNEADALKIVANATFGKLGDENSPLYDLKALYTVTINGQLYLIMLIDMLESVGIHCISANTDGIVCKVDKTMIDTYYRICKEWEKLTNFTLEYTNYEKYVCYAVNDYIAIKEGFSNTDKSDDDIKSFVKQKGLFVTDIQIDKGYNKPVVAKALLNYFTRGTSIDQFIRNHDNIYNFCISVKTGEDFDKEYHEIKNGKLHISKLQKNVRYYISKSNGVIMKRYRVPIIDKKGIRREYIALHKGVTSTVFNDFVKRDMKDYNIDYNYYIREANKIIYDIFNVNAKKQKNRAYGGLFNTLE